MAALFAGRPGLRLDAVAFFSVVLTADVFVFAGRPTERLAVADLVVFLAGLPAPAFVVGAVAFFGLPGALFAVAAPLAAAVEATAFLGGLPGPRFAVVALALVFVVLAADAVFLGRPGPRFTVVAAPVFGFGGRPGPRVEGMGVLEVFTAATFFSAALITL